MYKQFNLLLPHLISYTDLRMLHFATANPFLEFLLLSQTKTFPRQSQVIALYDYSIWLIARHSVPRNFFHYLCVISSLLIVILLF